MVGLSVDLEPNSSAAQTWCMFRTLWTSWLQHRKAQGQCLAHQAHSPKIRGLAPPHALGLYMHRTT